MSYIVPTAHNIHATSEIICRLCYHQIQHTSNKEKQVKNIIYPKAGTVLNDP